MATGQREFDWRYKSGTLHAWPGEYLLISEGRREHLKDNYDVEVDRLGTRGIHSCVGIAGYNDKYSFVAHLNHGMYSPKHLGGNLAEIRSRMGWDEKADKVWLITSESSGSNEELLEDMAPDIHRHLSEDLTLESVDSDSAGVKLALDTREISVEEDSGFCERTNWEADAEFRSSKGSVALESTYGSIT